MLHIRSYTALINHFTYKLHDHGTKDEMEHMADNGYLTTK
jgi:hypothetical protein